MTKLEKDVIEFILWLTPCGEVTENPTPKTIGNWARKLNRRIIRNGHKISNLCDGSGCVDKDCQSQVCRAINRR
jgi:hypothetical protein